jgi:hypothetical protein
MIKSIDDLDCQVLSGRLVACMGLNCLEDVAYLSPWPRGDFMGDLLGSYAKRYREWGQTTWWRDFRE